MVARSRVGVVVSLVAVGVLAGSLEGIPPLLRAPLALPLFFVLPGYALLGALFPGAAPARAERLLISVGASLALVIATGLALHLLPAGLTPATWALSLGALTVLLTALALRRSGPGASPPGGSARGGPSAAATSVSPLESDQRAVLFLGAAAMLVLVALGVAVRGAMDQPRTPFTELWILPAPAPDAVLVGVENHEGRASRYRVELTREGRELASWGPIELAPGERWEAIAGLEQASGPIEAALYRDGSTGDPYRRVLLWRGPVEDGRG